MRTKPIQRDEIRLDGLRIIALPINSVRRGKNGLEPIKKLWAPLLRSINAEEKKQWEDWVRRGISSREKFEPIRVLLSDVRHSPLSGHVRYYHAEKSKCQQCEREFYCLNGGYYCSDKCVAEAHKAAMVPITKARAKARAAARADRKCEGCGKPINAKRSTMRFCSVRCRVAAHRSSAAA
jgi:hypothetical protein